MATWPSLVRRIQNGLPVNAAIANRGVEDLTARTDYLKRVLEAFQAGHVQTHQDAPLVATTAVGHPVYWNTAQDAYDSALAVYTTTSTGVIVPDERSFVVGIVIEKTSAQVGTVALVGYVEDIDISAIIDDGDSTGMYYLSATTAGHITSTKPPLGVPVAILASDDTFWIFAGGRNSSAEHQHYAFHLTAAPAGDGFTLAADEYTIDSPDASAEGWLPATAAYFPSATIPEGAAFGYNLSQDADLQAAWPPEPIESVRFVVDGEDVPVGAALDGIIQVNSSGIWWMLNCDGYAPWANDWTPDSSSSSAGETCPPAWASGRTLTLYFTALTGLSGDAFVTRLVGTAPVSIVSCDSGEAASRGDLSISLDAFTSGTPTIPSGQCVYDLTRVQKKLGPNLAGIRVSGLGSAAGTSTYTHESTEYQTGFVNLAISSSNDNLELPVDLVALNDVGSDDYQGAMYWSMPTGRESSIRGKFVVPEYNVPDPAELSILFWFMTTTGGTLPDNLEVTYLRLASVAEGASAAISPPDTDLNVAANALDPGAVGALAGYTYTPVASDAIESVTAGDVIFFTLSWDGTGYAAALGVLKIKGLLAAASGSSE